MKHTPWVILFVAVLFTIWAYRTGRLSFIGV